MALQGAKPVTDRFKADAEPVTEQFDVVTAPFRLRQENGVRQNQCTGEIVRKPDAGEAARFVAGELRLVDDGTYRLVQFQNGDLRRELKRLLARIKARRQT